MMASSATPLVGRSKILPKTNGRTPTFSGKAKGRSNGSILNFFKKADSNPSLTGNDDEGEDSLFLEESPMKKDVEVPAQIPTPPRDYESPESPSRRVSQTVTDQGTPRFNEDPGPVKRRRVEGSPMRSTSSPSIKVEARPKEGPFIEDSNSDGETVEVISKCLPIKAADKTDQPFITPKSETDSEEHYWPVKSEKSPPIPSLQRENTSIVEKDEFDGIEDFIDDEFPEEGEEFLERRWMEEHRELEMGLEEDEDLGQDFERKGESMEGSKDNPRDSGAPSCPICSGSFTGLTDQV